MGLHYCITDYISFGVDPEGAVVIACGGQCCPACCGVLGQQVEG